jgi:hypothetical protein
MYSLFFKINVGWLFKNPCRTEVKRRVSRGGRIQQEPCDQEEVQDETVNKPKRFSRAERVKQQKHHHEDDPDHEEDSVPMMPSSIQTPKSLSSLSAGPPMQCFPSPYQQPDSRRTVSDVQPSLGLQRCDTSELVKEHRSSFFSRSDRRMSDRSQSLSNGLSAITDRNDEGEHHENGRQAL